MSDIHRTTPFEAEVEFQEDEIWAVIEHSQGTRNNFKAEEDFSSSSSSSSSRSSNAWGSKTKPMAIPGSSAVAPPQQSSAPVGSKILQQQKAPFHCDGDDDTYGEGHGMMKSHHHGRHHLFDINDEGLPPHEYMAKRLARRQFAAFSMCEGAEGRGLSRLRMRNAILTKTGFLD